MEHTFAAWESFYVIVGSSSAALTGLQFVVMALIADLHAPGGPTEISAFGTPTIVHFCIALMVSAVLSAPWHEPTGAAIAIALGGLFGFFYSMIVFRRARRTRAYQPVAEDWIWHVILPFVGYTALMVSGAMLFHPSDAPEFVIGAVTLLLVFIGIHNAWDTVEYLVTSNMKAKQGDTR